MARVAERLFRNGRVGGLSPGSCSRLWGVLRHDSGNVSSKQRKKREILINWVLVNWASCGSWGWVVDDGLVVQFPVPAVYMLIAVMFLCFQWPTTEKSCKSSLISCWWTNWGSGGRAVFHKLEGWWFDPHPWKPTCCAVCLGKIHQLKLSLFLVALWSYCPSWCAAGCQGLSMRESPLVL